MYYSCSKWSPIVCYSSFIVSVANEGTDKMCAKRVSLSLPRNVLIRRLAKILHIVDVKYDLETNN
jgi:hypothetical protein